MQESISKQLFCICPPRKQTRAAWGACAAAMRTSPPFATRPMVNCVAGKSEGYQSIRSSCRSHKRQIGHGYSNCTRVMVRHPGKLYTPRGKSTCWICNASTAESVSAFDQLSAGASRKYIMISGKGGVGKTSLAASLAVKFAEEGHVTLIVSTDPAHSLSDSLSQDVSGGKPVPIEGTMLPLWGMEVDPDNATEDLKDFAQTKAGKKTKQAAKSIGIGEKELADLKLGELLESPPPGLDESVALAKVVEFITNEEYAKFSRIVFDTAPTGHTLRLLNLPDFVGASLEKFIKLRRGLKKATGLIRGLFGTPDEEDQVDAIDRLENLQNRIDLVKLLFQNDKTTEFIIATIPTVLGINESSRLLTSLREQSIPCKRIIVNQLIGAGSAEAYLSMKIKDQTRSMELINNSPTLSKLDQVIAPMLDLEVRRIPALMYFANMVWKDVFDKMNEGQGQRFILVGGKGGVGKTTSAASLATQYAEAGYQTLVVSTDPAHSLSDAFDQNLSGGKPIQLEGTTLPLWGLEVNIEAARESMKDAVSGPDGLEGIMDDVGLGMLTDQIKDLKLGELLENPPPGSDEAIAIASVVQFLKDDEFSGFKRIVFDTAPTGHTIRLLTLPDFIEKIIGKVLTLQQQVKGAADMIKGAFGGKGEAKLDKALQKLENIKNSMEEARILFRDQDRTEFVVVSIPTVMSINESERLVQALDSEGVAVRTLLVNQVLEESATERFVESKKKDQERALALLKSDPGLKSLELIKAPMVDLEVRGLPALQYFGVQVWK